MLWVWEAGQEWGFGRFGGMVVWGFDRENRSLRVPSVGEKRGVRGNGRGGG